MPFYIASYCLVLITGFILVFQDIKESKVGVLPLVLFLISCISSSFFSKNLEFCFIPFFIFLFIGGIYYLIKKKLAFGLADYISIFAISFILPNYYWTEFIILCGAIGCISSVIFKNKKFPFIPAILTSILLSKLFAVYLIE